MIDNESLAHISGEHVRKLVDFECRYIRVYRKYRASIIRGVAIRTR